MGAWGTSISSNDTYADTYGEFFDLYNEGLEVGEISIKLIAENQETIRDADDCNNFWFALAKAQWECKQLDKQLFERIKVIVETGVDLDVWNRLDAEEKEIKKRKIVLDKFLIDLQTEKPKAKSRKKKIIRQPVFEKGDCLTFKLANGNYSGAVVLEAVKDTECGCNLIVSTRINQQNQPTKKDFENAEVLLLNFATWDNKPNIKWYRSKKHKMVSHLIERVDNIDVQLEYNIDTVKFGFVADFVIWFIEVADKQFESESITVRSTTKQTIKELTNKSKWKLW
jgi:hypothetical protein